MGKSPEELAKEMEVDLELDATNEQMTNPHDEFAKGIIVRINKTIELVVAGSEALMREAKSTSPHVDDCIGQLIISDELEDVFGLYYISGWYRHVSDEEPPEFDQEECRLATIDDLREFFSGQFK